MKIYGDAESLIADAAGFDPDVIGRKMIRDELRSLMDSLKIDDPHLCVRSLEENEEELERFIERMVVPETWFFRDREAFRFLRQWAGQRRPDDGLLRVLSVPCSTGEEAYSIVITLLEAGLKTGDFQVDAVDISAKALGKARNARYGRSSFRGESFSAFGRYFTPEEEGMRLDPVTAGLVRFTRGNVVRDDFSRERGVYSIIFCKNLLIYLNQEARLKLFRGLDRLLAPGGLLFAGHSELPSFLQFGYVRVAHSRSFACRKPEAGPPAEKRPEIVARAVRTANRTKRIAPEERRDLTAKTAPPGKKIGPHVEERFAADSSLESIRKLADHGNLGEAARLCGQYIKTQGPDKEGFYVMGLIDHAMDKADEAEELFLKALYLDPYYYEALLHMSLLCDQKGDSARAAVFRERLKRAESGQKALGDEA